MEPPRTHQLTRLFDALAHVGLAPELPVEALDALTPFAIDDKVPRLRVTQITRDEAMEFLPIATAATDWLAAQLQLARATAG